MWGPIIGMMDGGDRAKMDKQRQRIHDITYSCDDRAELAERIVTLEDENAKLRELCAEMFEDLDGVIGDGDTIVADRGRSRWLLDKSDVDAYRNRMCELGIEVDDDD